MIIEYQCSSITWGEVMGSKLVFFIIGIIILVDLVAIAVYIHFYKCKKGNNHHQDKPE
jgi:hypothetical protein